MKRVIMVLAALAIIFISASAQASTWKRLKSKKLGFSMLVPKGAKVEDRTWPGGWVGLQAERKGIKVLAAAMLGKKNTAILMREFAQQITGTERKHWTVIKTVKARGGWVWYCPAKARHNKNAFFAVYGIGRKGTYLMLLITSRAGARKHRAALVRWTRGVKLLK